MEYRNKLNPERSLRTSHEIKGTRQKVIVTHNSSEIDQNQLLLVRFPNLGVLMLSSQEQQIFLLTLSYLTQKEHKEH